MMELESSQRFGHAHRLVFNEGQELDNGSEKAKYCSRCGEIVLGPTPSFSCMEKECGFHLHKQCAEAASEIHHPFHRHHPLLLRPNPPTIRRCYCHFCSKECKMFVYHCSACALQFHIKCALFSSSIAVQPLISEENDPTNKEELQTEKCFECWNPLLESPYFSLDCGFNLHKKCVELPLEINHPLHPQIPLILQFNSKRLGCKICNQTQLSGLVYCCLTCCNFVLHIKCADLPLQIDHLCHRKHPLLLQFNGEDLSCKICQGSKCKGFVYCCSPCKFVIHRECVSPPAAVVEDKRSHQHPFNLFWKQVPFVCDACGLEGNCVSYICYTCSLTLHKKCISLPRAIKISWHRHPLLHTYFLRLRSDQLNNLDCRICCDEMNAEYGSYYCNDCDFMVHVDCATSKKYQVVELDSNGLKLSNGDHDLALLPNISSITSVLDRNENGEATKIKHFSHAHVLTLKGDDDDDDDTDKHCDGCILPISTMFYSCLQCGFFLHKSCAELPMKRVVWFHHCRDPFTLVSGFIFICRHCKLTSTGFAYMCNECNFRHCLRCCNIPRILTTPAHEHPLPFHSKFKGPCNGCGSEGKGRHKCKSCQFSLNPRCITLPVKVQNRCDEHPLSLTYHENNDYPEYHYCDICEERRNPNYWFYHCAICVTSAHVNCVIGAYPFIKVGSIFKGIVHPHPQTFVKKIYDYPICYKCGKLCQDLVLECEEPGCIYTVHWKCIKPPPPFLSERRAIALYKSHDSSV